MEDEDTCRICRSGPEPNSPLYYPCKCTGSIRYCHQDCLVEWLQHSRKKYCELCNHPFIFHKKYRKNMPSDGKLPRYLYIRRLLIRSAQNIPQNFDVDAGQPAPVPQPQDPREQMIEDLNRQRQQFEELLARAQAEQPQAQDEVHDADEREHELELDPEVQREQARQARIRRLEQMFANVAGGQQLEEEQTLAEQNRQEVGNVDDSAETVVADSIAESNGFESAAEHDHDAQAEAGPSSSTSNASDTKTTAVDVAKGSQDSEQQDGASSSIQAEPSSSTSNAASQETPRDAPTETDATNVGIQAEQPSPAPPAQAAVNPSEPTETANDEDAWEDESDPGADPAPRDEAALRLAAAAVFPPPIAHFGADDDDDIIEINAAAAAAAGNLDPNDPDAEVGLAEEMDGILEAIGMRGPVFGIVQNLFLLIFLCGFVMLAFVMAPYVVGRALGSGPGLVRLLAMPVKVLRYVTDPVFDGLIALGANKNWPRIASAVGWKSQSEVELVQAAAAGWLQKVLPSMLAKSGTQEVAEQAAAGARVSAVAAMLVRLLPTSVPASSQWKTVSDSFDIALSAGFQGTLHKIFDSITEFFARLDAHRNGTSTTDRIFCVAFGHFYWLLLLFVYQHFSKPDLQRAMAQDSALKLYIDQHVLILKALSFIFIELVIFPLGCGLLLDVCTMPFLAEASIFSWPAKIRSAPLSFGFTRWMGGTIYMFVFAQYC
ncbi:hypothetical protein NDA16_005113 [Ustilago loliicola]|nr:hypothetical protein NDA16_005113 [Ustilago loliicola]